MHYNVVVTSDHELQAARVMLRIVQNYGDTILTVYRRPRLEGQPEQAVALRTKYLGALGAKVDILKIPSK
jgi:hypothetical protein